MDLEAVLAELRADPEFGPLIAWSRRDPPREAQFAEPTHPIHEALAAALEAQGLANLYVHQALAHDRASEGRDVAVVTGTSSGKTLCYNLPVLSSLLSQPAARAIYLFPTKALAQDQLGKLEALAGPLGLRSGAYDGDTPTAQRAAIRRNAHIVLTNPDMLHMGILPRHETWAKFLRSLRFLVIDEMHAYRGIFGSHVGGVVRRLLRLCDWYGSRPQIIACSATIRNPDELFFALTSRRAEPIEVDGAPSGPRLTIMAANPDLDQKRSANKDVARALAQLVAGGVRTLAFCRSRVGTELLLRLTRGLLEGQDLNPAQVESYRSGYTPKERREIEQKLFQGELLGLASTNAMELGVDVGGLDAAILNGFPGSVASFRQQVGRAGRGGRPGLAMMLAHDDPLEQFLVRFPERLLEATVETANVNPANPYVLTQQLRCAAYERALDASELPAFGEGAVALAESLEAQGDLRYTAGRFYYPSHDPPAAKVNLRGMSGPNVTLVLNGKALGTMERWRALQSAHEGAVYLHRGDTYVVKELDLAESVAQVTEERPPYYTQAVAQMLVETKVGLERAGPWQLAGLHVTSVVIGYNKMALDGNTILSVHDLDLPPEQMDTLGVRLDLPAPDPEGDMLEAAAGVHAVQHALMAVAPLLAGCDPGDLETAWYAIYPDTFAPAVFVYDNVPGGVGLAERLFADRSAWLTAALELVESCACAEGCPGCLLSPRLPNEPLSKRAALELLKGLRSCEP